MKEHKWICLNCSRTGVCACFELSDMMHLPDLTIEPSHHRVSPDCAHPKICFAIEGQIFEWIRSPTPAEASSEKLALPKTILLLIELYGKKVVIIESLKWMSPEARAKGLKNAITAAGKTKEMLVYAEIPSSIESLSAFPLPSSNEDQKHTVIFVGPKDSWGKWEHMLKEHGEPSLLSQSIVFFC